MEISPYKARCTVMNGVWRIAGWKIKVYTIHETDRNLEHGIVDAAVQHAADHVAWPQDHTGYGFLTVHFGNEAVWLLVDLWVDDILRHFLFCAPVENPCKFGEGPKDGTMACVWELAVFVHERDSWIQHVMSQPEKPNYESYLGDKLEIIP